MPKGKGYGKSAASRKGGKAKKKKEKEEKEAPMKGKRMYPRKFSA